MRCFSVFEKILINIIKTVSVAAYVFFMGLLFAFPINFAIQAFIPPVLTVNEVGTAAIEENGIIPAAEINEWTRIDYKITASSGWASPYDYLIEEFTVKNEDILSEAKEYKVILDEPSVFTKDSPDDMTISLYLRLDGDADASDVMENVTFKAKVYEKNFAQFKAKYGNGNLWK